ncbi:MAG: metallophosphoesterase [Pseudomonadota bacterium]
MPSIVRPISILLTIFACLIPTAVAKTLPAPARTVAIGDIHGDYDAYMSILQAAGLTDGRGRWTGGETVLVQTGDIPDRGPDTLRIIEHLMELEKDARKDGGEVVALIGNHEAMNVTGDLRFVTPEEYAAFETRRSKSVRDRAWKANREALLTAYRERDPTLTDEDIKAKWYAATPLGWLEHRAAWSPEGRIGKWVTGNATVARFGDTIFLHGGIGPAYRALPLDEINARATMALMAASADPGAIVNDTAGPLWYRGLIPGAPVAGPSPEDLAKAKAAAAAAPRTGSRLKAPSPAPATPPPHDAEAEIMATLASYGAARIVVGHTPARSGVRFHADGRLVQIDTGISAYYKGRRGWLEIVGNTAIGYEVGPDGSAVETGRAALPATEAQP